MDTFSYGPFALAPGRAMRLAGVPSRSWSFSYHSDLLAERSLPESASQSEIIDAFLCDRAEFIRRCRREHAANRIALVDFETGDEVAHFYSFDSCGMSRGLIDDRSRYWIRSADSHYSRDVTLTQFAQIAAEHAAPENGWLASLLPGDVLTSDADEWRAPTAWEIRHIVGEGSFTGITGAKAAAIVGVTPQNFRKYTARDGAATRQNISFAMWHLLLHKLGVKRA